MEAQKNKNSKEIVRQINKAKNENNRETLLKLLSPQFIGHIAGYQGPVDRETYIAAIELFHAAFSPLTFTVQDMVEEGDKVAVRILICGKHVGDYQGHEASLNEIKYEGMIIKRIQDGLIVEEWQVNDTLGLLRQIGLSVNHII